MLQRINQFFQALNAKMEFSEVMYIREVLSENEARLFFTMSEVDQKHAFSVAKTAMSLARSERDNVNEVLLLRASLLHDIGKEAGDMTIMQRVFCVLFVALDNKSALSYADKDAIKGSFKRALYVYFHHPLLGAQKIKQVVGNDKLAELVFYHQEPVNINDSVELMLLKRADLLN